jgi:tetratricopeptide (TPR) repeat protein
MRPHTPTTTDSWHQYTCRGNTEYQLACYGDAILLHNQALDHARHQFTSSAPCCFGHVLSQVLISHFSLADCYRALAQPNRAAACYQDALRFLRRATQQLPAVEGALDAVLQAGTHLHTLWCEFVQEFPEVPELASLDYHRDSQNLWVTLKQYAVQH